MISVEEAKLIVMQNVQELKEGLIVSVKDALGFRLSEAIYSPADLPPFDQSNVDGYAVCGNLQTWTVTTEIKAGDFSSIQLESGRAARIYTGSMVPPGSDSVIMQERINRDGNAISITDDFKNGEHIRKKGSQIKTGEMALPEGITINPSAIGFISSMGLKEINVYRKPEIVLVITGNELQEAGTEPQPGKIYESSSLALAAAVNAMGLSIREIIFVKDDKEGVAEAVGIAMKKADLLLISGGISVGDYDFVSEVLQENGTKTLFYKVAQKPGKPLFFGENAGTYIFGLPGNPASALTCFYEFVYPCLRKMQGYKNPFLQLVQLPATFALTKKSGLSFFLKAYAGEAYVTSLEGQESYKMRSFAEANAFIYLPSEKESVSAGELVEVHLLPGF